MTNETAKALAGYALRSNLIANRALNTIDQSTTDPGVYSALFQLSEAVSQLCSAILSLVDGSEVPL